MAVVARFVELFCCGGVGLIIEDVGALLLVVVVIGSFGVLLLEESIAAMLWALVDDVGAELTGCFVAGAVVGVGADRIRGKQIKIMFSGLV